VAYQYRVVPFIGSVRGNQGAQEVAAQLESVVNKFAAEGWEFCQSCDVNIEVSPGCLGALLGAKVTYVRYDQVVFRRPV
jgi:hypothetical protein